MKGHPEHKRIIICCDGTWMSSIGLKGAQPPSNVTRIARCLKRSCSDGTPQIIVYDPGVGSSASKVDQWFGGAFGMGLEQNIRETYNFICNNYLEGDEIILIGFSRGAFTARSVADMIGTFGLLTPDGQDHFNEIFEDYENIADTGRKLSKYMKGPKLIAWPDSDPNVTKEQWVRKRKAAYIKYLVEKEYTRGRFTDQETGPDVKIRAIAVWDTVGTLGIPPAPIVGIRGSAAQWKFTDTKISDKVENAFQALALDEPRYAFRPAMWERHDGSKTNLKQVWFPGNHGGVGGGWWDQSLSDITLAWMVDQLTPLGIEFDHAQLSQCFTKSLAYLAAHPFPYIPAQIPLPTTHYVKQYFPLDHWVSLLLKRRATPWGNESIYHAPAGSSTPVCDYDDCPAYNHVHEWPLPKNALPGRPWALGQLRFPDSFFQCFVGSWVRTPGMTLRVDPETNEDIPKQWLKRTEERIHSSVRVRLACQGLGWDDRGEWECKALTGNPTNDVRWRLVKGKSTERVVGGGDTCGCADAGEGDGKKLYEVGEADCDWHWVFDSKKDKMEPEVKQIPEEPLTGYWERYLLGLNCGERDVWKFALENPPVKAMEK